MSISSLVNKSCCGVQCRDPRLPLFNSFHNDMQEAGRTVGKNGAPSGAAPRHQLIVGGNYIVITLSDFESRRRGRMHGHTLCLFGTIKCDSHNYALNHTLPSKPENLIRPLITDKCYCRCGLSLAQALCARFVFSLGE